LRKIETSFLGEGKIGVDEEWQNQECQQGRKQHKR